eukprot:COSAG01_NODE_8218_length_2870_cov_4.446770_1_plen_67_part_00
MQPNNASATFISTDFGGRGIRTSGGTVRNVGYREVLASLSATGVANVNIANSTLTLQRRGGAAAQP